MPFLDLAGTGPAPIRLRQVGRNRFQLLTGFQYARGGTPPIVVPPHDESVPASSQGNSTDLASVPWPVWGLIASHGRQTLPALLHDHLSNEARAVPGKPGLRKRQAADRLFRETLVEQDVALLRAWLMWAAVALFAYKDFAFARFLGLLTQAVLGVGAVVSAFLLDGRPAFAAVVAPAVASVLWGRWFAVPLIASYAGALLLPALVTTVVTSWILVGMATLVWVATGCKGPSPDFRPTRLQALGL